MVIVKSLIQGVALVTKIKVMLLSKNMKVNLTFEYYYQGKIFSVLNFNLVTTLIQGAAHEMRHDILNFHMNLTFSVLCF